MKVEYDETTLATCPECGLRWEVHVEGMVGYGEVDDPKLRCPVCPLEAKLERLVDR